MELGSLIRIKNVNTVFACNINIVIILFMHSYVNIFVSKVNTNLECKSCLIINRSRARKYSIDRIQNSVILCKIISVYKCTKNIKT